MHMPAMFETRTPNNTALKAGTTPRGIYVKLYSARPTPEARHTRNFRNPLPEFCNSLKVRDNIIVRVHDNERARNWNEDYFVANIEKGARKLDEGGVYSAVRYNKGDWILFGYVGMNWVLQRTVQLEIGFVQKDLPNGFLVIP